MACKLFLCVYVRCMNWRLDLQCDGAEVVETLSGKPGGRQLVY